MTNFYIILTFTRADLLITVTSISFNFFEYLILVIVFMQQYLIFSCSNIYVKLRRLNLNRYMRLNRRGPDDRPKDLFLLKIYVNIF